MLGAVGREVELEHLRRCFDKALTGVRQVVFVTGEAGLGKTTVVEAFLAQVGDREAFRIGRGQCIEHYGVGEAYLPVLESLGRLCQAAGGAESGDDAPASGGAPAVGAAAVIRLPEDGVSLRDVQYELVRQAMERTGGNQTKAAQLLRISRDALRYKIKSFGLT